MAASFTKQPYEAFGIDGDFVNVLETGETLILGSSSVTAQDKDGNDMTNTVLDQSTIAVDGTKLKIRCQAGIPAESPYKITFRTVTSLDNQFEVDVNMKVKEI